MPRSPFFFRLQGDTSIHKTVTFFKAGFLPAFFHAAKGIHSRRKNSVKFPLLVEMTRQTATFFYVRYFPCFPCYFCGRVFKPVWGGTAKRASRHVCHPPTFAGGEKTLGTGIQMTVKTHSPGEKYPAIKSGDFTRLVRYLRQYLVKTSRNLSDLDDLRGRFVFLRKVEVVSAPLEFCYECFVVDCFQ